MERKRSALWQRHHRTWEAPHAPRCAGMRAARTATGLGSRRRPHGTGTPGTATASWSSGAPRGRDGRTEGAHLSHPSIAPRSCVQTSGRTAPSPQTQGASPHRTAGHRRPRAPEPAPRAPVARGRPQHQQQPPPRRAPCTATSIAAARLTLRRRHPMPPRGHSTQPQAPPKSTTRTQGAEFSRRRILFAGDSILLAGDSRRRRRRLAYKRFPPTAQASESHSCQRSPRAAELEGSSSRSSASAVASRPSSTATDGNPPG